MWGGRDYSGGSTLCAWLSSSTLPAWLPGVPPKGIPHSSLLPPVPLDHFPAVSSSAHPGIALESLPSSSQPMCVSFLVVRACCQLSAGALRDPLHLKTRSWYTCGDSCVHLTSTYSSAILTPFRQRQKIRFFPWLLRFNSHRRIVIISPDFSTFFFFFLTLELVKPFSWNSGKKFLPETTAICT